MATDVSSYFFERKLQGNAYGLIYQVAVAAESFDPEINRQSRILLVPSMGGDATSDRDLRSFLESYLGNSVLTDRDFMRVLTPYGVTPAMTRLLLASHQRAFAVHMLGAGRSLKFGRKWPRAAQGVEPLQASISDLELLGSVNQIKSDPHAAANMLALMRSRAPEAYWQSVNAFQTLLARSSRLAAFACQKLGIRYVVLTFIRHPHHQSNFGGVGRYPEKVQMTAGVIDLRDGTFVLYAESETKQATDHAPPGILLATMLRQVLRREKSRRRMH